jgi:hypothetical protein
MIRSNLSAAGRRPSAIHGLANIYYLLAEWTSRATYQTALALAANQFHPAFGPSYSQ